MYDHSVLTFSVLLVSGYVDDRGLDEGRCGRILRIASLLFPQWGQADQLRSRVSPSSPEKPHRYLSDGTRNTAPVRPCEDA